MLLYFHKKSQTQHRDLGKKSSLMPNDLVQKYMSYTLVTNACVLLIFFIPLMFFYSQNYETMKLIAYETFPQLLVHLEQETTWLIFFSGVCFLSILCFSALWTFKMCKDVTNSLSKIQGHMRNVYSHQGLKTSFHVNETETLKTFVSSYESFIYNLKEDTEAELQLIEKLNIDPLRKDSFQAWKELIAMKKNRLGLEEEQLKLIISNDASPDESGHPRRVS
jgi:hypothetical protein